jgi:hypothetical protein
MNELLAQGFWVFTVLFCGKTYKSIIINVYLKRVEVSYQYIDT